MKRETKKRKGRKFLILVIVIASVTLSGNVLAKNRGVKLTVQKKNDQQVIGELIAVKKDTLLLLESISTTDVSINIKEIETIKIENRSHVLAGLGLGSVVGAGIGALGPLGLNIAFQTRPSPAILKASSKYAKIYGAIGLLAGGIIGAATGIDEKIQVEGRSFEKIKEILEKLRLKARFPDYK